MIFTILKVHRHHTPCSACSYTYSAALRIVCTGSSTGLSEALTIQT